MNIKLTNANPDTVIPDGLVLWRYLDFPKLLDLLSTNTIKLPRASKMEDGFEGMMGFAALERRVAAAKVRGEPAYLRNAVINKEQKESLFWRDRTYISCWNAFPTENAGLWRIYGDEKGVAIRTTWGSLRKGLSGPADCVDTIFYGHVNYGQSADPGVLDTYTDQYFVKRPEFVHEREFRLVAHDQSLDHDYKRSSLEGVPYFASIQCDLNVAIEEILVSPRLGGWVREAVEDVIRNYGGMWPVNRSNLYQAPTLDTQMF